MAWRGKSRGPLVLLRLVFKKSSATSCARLLTIVGLVVAILAFGLLRTVVDAWYAGADGALADARWSRATRSRSCSACRPITRERIRRSTA